MVDDLHVDWSFFRLDVAEVSNVTDVVPGPAVTTLGEWNVVIDGVTSCRFPREMRKAGRESALLGLQAELRPLWKDEWLSCNLCYKGKVGQFGL